MGSAAESLADDLGVAMQLTNILRDVREDAENGRVYLPGEDLRRFGVVGEDGVGNAPAVLASLVGGPPGSGAHPDDAQLERLYSLVRFQADRAHQWFQRGMELAPLLDRRSAACLQAMAGIYRRLLNRIQARPERALAARISLPAPEKAWVAVRSMLGGSG
jgi:phytoene synthase